MSTLNTLTRRFLNDEDGATLVEYGLLVLLIAVVAIGAVTALGAKVNTVFTTANSKLTGGGVAP